MEYAQEALYFSEDSSLHQAGQEGNDSYILVVFATAVHLEFQVLR